MSRAVQSQWSCRPVVALLTRKEAEAVLRERMREAGKIWMGSCESPFYYRLEGVHDAGQRSFMSDTGLLGEAGLRKYYPPTGKSVQEFMATLQGIPA